MGDVQGGVDGHRRRSGLGQVDVRWVVPGQMDKRTGDRLGWMEGRTRGELDEGWLGRRTEGHWWDGQTDG